MRKKRHNFLEMVYTIYNAALQNLFKTRVIPAFIACFAAAVDCPAQSKIGIENYNYWGQANSNVIVPMIHIETNNNWYAEVRYNYEDAETLSFFGGKTFSGGKSLEYSVTPMTGVSVGNFTGVSFATNAEVDWKNFYMASQTQYSIATKKNLSNFFFSWSELGYNITDNFFGGLALQYTLQQGMNDTEPGLFAGVNFKSVSIPFYVFSPFQAGRYFVLGLNYEYNFKKQR
jgi:hypothetical protein